MERDTQEIQAEALGVLAQTAWQWARSLEGGDRDWASGVALLRDAGGWIYAATSYRERPASIQEVLQALRTPIGQVLPDFAGESAPLIDSEGRPTIRCEEILGEARASFEGAEPSVGYRHLLLEYAQQKVQSVRQRLKTGDLPGGAAAYTAFRRFLIDHPFAPDLTELRLEAGEAMPDEAAEALTGLYGPVPAWAQDDAGRVYPCPRCRWPMAVQSDRITCRGSGCQREGVLFDRAPEGLIPQAYSPPEPEPASNATACLPLGIWRYTVQPGIEELRLAEALKAAGAEVTLWPGLDAYDLHVALGEAEWFVDVKDWQSAVWLSRSLAPLPGRVLTVVVPDHRGDQLDYLRRAHSKEPGFAFATTTQFLREVRDHE